jgi:Transmembrane domain of unknown function (DUF3566)
MREDGLDRRTDDPDESGGASPTVVTSRQDGDDLISGDGRDTRPVSTIVPSPLMPRILGDAPAIPSAWNAPAVGSIAGGNGKDGSDAAVTEAAADDAPAGPDAFGTSALDSPAFDTSTFSFSAPDPPVLDSWGPVSWSLSDSDESSADGALATDPPARREPEASPAFEQSSFSASYTPLPAVSEPVAPQPSPDPPAVSAAAFTWETPEPPPTSPSSPARTFLRSAGNVKPAPPAMPTVTAASPQQPAPSPTPATVRRAPPKAAAKRSVRQAHLTIARVEPWSVMKFSFVVSLVAFVILFVVVTVLWGSLSALGVFDSLQRVVSSVTSSQASNGVNAAKWFSASRILGWTALLGSLNIVLITAMSTIGAVVYNLTSRLVGGVEVTLRETE